MLCSPIDTRVSPPVVVAQRLVMDGMLRNFQSNCLQHPSSHVGRLSRFRPTWLRLARVLPVVLSLVLGLAACQGTSSIGHNRGEGASASTANRTIGAESLQKGGGLCDQNRRVSHPEPDAPEWPIWRAYELALGPDTDANFEAFRALFPPGENPRELKEMKWSRIRSSVHKFTVEPGKPDFVICRTMATDQGRKYFIVTSDPRQLPPPITVGEVEGKNRIVFMTPF